MQDLTGSVLVSGSNPHADYTVDNVKFKTEYRVEYFYPSYYNSYRPQPQGLLTQLSYGGPYFNVTLTKQDLAGDVNNVKETTVILLRTGFSTHTMVRQLWKVRDNWMLKSTSTRRTWASGSCSSTRPTPATPTEARSSTSARFRPTLRSLPLVLLVSSPLP